MITMLLAAMLASSSPTSGASALSPVIKDLAAAPPQTLADTRGKPPLLRDLRGPLTTPLDAPGQAKPPLLRDLRGPATTPLDAPGSSPVLKVLPPGAIPPPGSLSLQERDKLAFAGKLCVRPAIKTLGPKGAPVRKLGDLPPGLLEHAVNRLVNGCPVREIVSGGNTYYLDAPLGGLERLDPVVHITKLPAGER